MIKRVISLLVTMSILPIAIASSDRLIIHEWGTFTSLQDESGRTIGGVNIDDEPVPNFVHNLLLD